MNLLLVENKAQISPQPAGNTDHSAVSSLLKPAAVAAATPHTTMRKTCLGLMLSFFLLLFLLSTDGRKRAQGLHISQADN